MDKLLKIIKKIIPKKFFKALQPAYHFCLSWLSALVYGFPSNKMIIIGVTGTTGKTTIVYLIAKMLNEAGYKTGFTSTAVFNDGKKEWLNDKKMTMVGRFFTQKILKDMFQNGCRFAVVETSSEGIRQFRHRFINYDILVFSGLYPEHIESHGSFENYKKAKGRLFSHLKNCRIKYADDDKSIVHSKSEIKKLDLNRIKKTIICNLNDEHADYFLDFWSEKKLGYILKPDNYSGDKKIDQIISFGDIDMKADGLSFKYEGNKINLNLLGEFNAGNAMAAVCLGISFDLEKEKIKAGLEKISGIPGRLELIEENQNFLLIVDYAFEPKAVAELYKIVKNIPHNKIIHLLGSAGGGRDSSRRPVLGKLAAENADIVIVSNEDPYDENPQIIIDQVALGAEYAGKKIGRDLFKIFDRGEAIKKAIESAEENDIVLITGKGSEQAICVANGEKIPWDDRLEARKYLKLKTQY
jgi:UDP-N-acetylmuramoyl-L-alanyl-D-glutamate--2,6-diaminopimelate ligase